MLWVQRRIKKHLEVRFHHDFGVGIANTIMAQSLGVADATAQEQASTWRTGHDK